METRKAVYSEKDDFTEFEWIKAKRLYVLKNTFLVMYEAEIDDAKGGATAIMPLFLEYPKRLLCRFKKQYGLT